MKYGINDFEEKDTFYSDFVDSAVYSMYAIKYAQIIDDYYLLCVKKKPWWLPNKLYKFLLKNILVLINFKATNNNK